MTRMPTNNVPLLGQAQAQAKAGIMQAVNGLSMAIYTRIASFYVIDPPPSQAQLHDTARYAHQAAQAYFEGLGVAEFDHPPASAPEGGG